MRRPSRNQAGASMYIALVAIIVVVGLVGSLALLSATALRATGPFVTDAEKRTAADGALKSAINFAAKNTTLGRDPAIFPSDPTCGYRVPASQTGSIDVTVTCAAVAGSQSGAPEETGKIPDQALLLLGQNYGQPPTYSPCTGSSTDRRSSNAREYGLTVDPIAVQKDGSGTITCVDNNGAVNPDVGLKIKGDIKSNSPVRVAGGTRLTVDGTVTTGTSPLFYLNAPSATGCSGNIRNLANAAVPCSLVASGARSGFGDGSPTSSDPFNPNETLFKDPALDATKGVEWRQGTVNWGAPRVSFNGAAPIELKDDTLISCAKNQNLIRFYPGLYTKAADLNRLFANTSCSKGADGQHPGIYWFGPEDGTNGASFAYPALGTATQGVYTFDFRDTSGGTACGLFTNTNNLHRWCLYPDASNDNGPIVVGGWPKGWEPGGVVATLPNQGAGQNSVTMNMTPPTGVDTDGSQSWTMPGNWLTTYNDGNVATYKPTGLLGTSTNRSIILSNFGTIGSVQSGGTISFKIRHQESRSGRINNPQLVLSTIDRGSQVQCGTFTVPKSTDTNSQTADALVEHTISTGPADNTGFTTPAQRNQIRSCFSNPDRIKNLLVKWQVTGDPYNHGTCTTLFDWDFLAPATCPGADNVTKPRVFIDGVQVSVDVPTGGFFSSDAAVPANYCDPKNPGVQFIFGGDSTVHTGTAALQVCAGPPPSTPESFQQIAIWGQPINFLTKQGATSLRVGKTGLASLVPTNVTTAVTDCGPVFLGIGCFADPFWMNAAWAVRPDNPYTNPAKPSMSVKADFIAGRAVNTEGTATFTGFGKVANFGTSDCLTGNDTVRAKNICIDTATQQVSKVQLKINYTTACPDPSSVPPWLQVVSNWIFCSNTSKPVNYEVSGSSGGNWSCSGSMPAMQASKLSWWYQDIGTCAEFNSAAKRLSHLNDPTLKVKLTFPCLFCTNNNKQVEGVEILPTITSTGNSVTPATGCRVGPIGYGAGVGDQSPLTQDSYLAVTSSPECALISSTAPTTSGGALVRPGGRVSVQGTIYAPSDAIEIADGDVMYPFASRGLVARHLRVRGMQFRPPYNDTSITNDIDKSAHDRLVNLVACSRSSANVTTPCGSLAGDKVLAKAGVRFAVDTSPSAPSSPPDAKVRIPQVLWWDSEKT